MMYWRRKGHKIVAVLGLALGASLLLGRFEVLDMSFADWTTIIAMIVCSLSISTCADKISEGYPR